MLKVSELTFFADYLLSHFFFCSLQNCITAVFQYVSFKEEERKHREIRKKLLNSNQKIQKKK